MKIRNEYHIPAIVSAVFLVFLFLGMFFLNDLGNRNELALPEIRIRVSKKSMWKLRVAREKAIREGVLISTDADWVKADILTEKDPIAASIRLKGDWTDHLETGKWSFRVKIKDSLAYMGMTVFSLQSPHTRSFLKEWLFHQVLTDEEIIAPRYRFVKLIFAGIQLGIYAMEEHFTKELIEAHGYREGPILKYSEEGEWEARRAEGLYPGFSYERYNVYAAAETGAFQEKKWLDSLNIRLFRNGINAMEMYKRGEGQPDLFFNTELVAKQYALTDLFEGHHSFIWHNRRFYFNPLIQKLEPIVFDAYTGDDAVTYLHGPFAGYGANEFSYYGGEADVLGTYFYRSEEFLEKYYQYLHRFSNESFIDSINGKYGMTIGSLTNVLHSEYPLYSFDLSTIRGRAGTIRKALKNIRTEMIRLEWADSSETIRSGCLNNYSPLVLKVLGSGTGNENKYFQVPRVLYGYDPKGPPASFEFNKTMAEYFLLTVPGSRDTLKIDIKKSGAR